MMPSMSSSSHSVANADGTFGGSTSAISNGDWNVNFGSGSIVPAVAAPKNFLMIAVAAVGFLWLARRHQ